MKCLLCGKENLVVISKELRSGEKRDVFFCKKCELGMLSDNASEAELKKFYDQVYRKKFSPRLNKSTNPRELYEIGSKFQGGRISLLKKHLNKNMKLLEMGCSAGMFLNQAKKYVKEVVGIDYDSKSADFAAKKCKCKVYSCNLDETGLKNGSFDAICMFQMLEHVKDPYKFVENAGKYLKNKGTICIEVPNLYDALIYAYNLPNHYKFYFHAAHLWYFTTKSLSDLMKRLGFIGKVYFSQDYNILNHLHWISEDAPQKDCIAGLSAPEFPLRNKSIELNSLNKFIQRTDADYKKLLEKLGLTSNLVFIGKKRPESRKA